jgi:BirA family biotin operon repressor/biotin-[acetyl-CoA-carboxylase] ligase
MLTIAGGVALAEGLRASTGLAVELKWPNDLIAPGGRRKVGGILAEASASGSAIDVVVFGFGVNVREAALPRELADRASALEIELGRRVDRGLVLAECLAALSARLRDVEAGRGAEIRDRWRALAPSVRGRRVEWTTGAGGAIVRRGIVEDIDETGALLVRVGPNVERIVSGEVRWV